MVRLGGVRLGTVRQMWHGQVSRGQVGIAGFGMAVMDGKELKVLRYKLGLSLAEASRQVEVTPRTWARWEAGERSIPRGAIKLFYIMNDLGDPPIK